MKTSKNIRSFKNSDSEFLSKHYKLFDEIFSDPFKGFMEAEIFEQLKENFNLTTNQLLVKMLPAAEIFVRAPISNFNVGSIVLAESGNLYFGANIELENCPLQVTIHSEQAAIINAVLHKERSIRTLATSVTPCGHCRQFINELNSANTIKILLCDEQELTLDNFFPNGFGPGDLGNSKGLMDKYFQELEIDFVPSLMESEALMQAKFSYSPYTKTFSGAAFKLKTGEIFHGTYIENVAFNPSVTPISSALVHCIMSGKDINDISEAVLIEDKDVPNSQIEFSKIILKSISAVELQVKTAVKIN
ncbi:MAG: cytidine deaminase [Ignavibacteria bacterium]|jgi:cytidine deaminase